MMRLELAETERETVSAEAEGEMTEHSGIGVRDAADRGE